MLHGPRNLLVLGV